MFQQLFRGRFLYLTFGLLVLLLYWRELRHHASRPQAMPEMSAPAPARPHWPQELDLAAAQQRLAHRPLLAFVASLLSFFITGMSLGGVGLTGWALATGRLRQAWRLPPRRFPPWSFAELWRLVMLTAILAALLPFAHLGLVALQPEREPDTHAWLVGSMLVLDTCVIFAIFAFAAGKRRSIWRAVGFSGRPLWPSIIAGLRGYVGVFPWLFALLFLIVEIAQRLGFQPPLEPIHELLFEEHRHAMLALTALLACGVGPVAEELLFRGVVYPTLRRRTGPVIAMLVSAAVFSAIHTSLVGFVPIMGLGVLLAYLYERTGSLISSLTVHIVHNTLLFGAAMLFRQILVPS